MSSRSSADAGGPRRVALLGSTGSIGRQAVDVLAADPSFQVVALATGSRADVLAEQVARLRPAVVAIADDESRRALVALGLPAGTDVLGGEDALVELATRPDVDIVLVGTGGVVSLRPVIAALDAGKIVATANKETLVAGGHLVMPRARARAEERARDRSRRPARELPRLASTDRFRAFRDLAVPRR